MGDGEDFENIVAEYHKRRGYNAELTSHSHDYGADIILYQKGKIFHKSKKIVVQTKYLSNGKVPIDAVQEIAGAIKHYHADEGWVITNATFTNNAIHLAISNNIKLIENFSDDTLQPVRSFLSFIPSFKSKKDFEMIAVAGFCLFAFVIFFFVLPSLPSEQNSKNTAIQKAEAFYDSGKYLESIEQYNVALSINPNDEQSWYNQGVSFDRLKRYDDALNCYNNAVKINPKNAKYWNGKGVALLRLNRIKESCPVFEKAYALDPSDTTIKNNYNEVKDVCNF